jgi:small subunit ribosomal protein S8
MVSTDPIADMLARIRNAIAVHKHEVRVPHSKVKESVAQLLKQRTFLDDVKVETEGGRRTLVLSINHPDSNARITEIVRLSKPGRRSYAGVADIPVIKRGRGLVIVSTSKGMMTGDDARSQHLGGELICKVY